METKNYIDLFKINSISTIEEKINKRIKYVKKEKTFFRKKEKEYFLWYGDKYDMDYFSKEKRFLVKNNIVYDAPKIYLTMNNNNNTIILYFLSNLDMFSFVRDIFSPDKLGNSKYN